MVFPLLLLIVMQIGRLVILPNLLKIKRFINCFQNVTNGYLINHFLLIFLFKRYVNVWEVNDKFFLPRRENGQFLRISETSGDTYYTEVITF